AAAAGATTTADFVYADFNSTHGLTFAGASGTTACANVTEFDYGDVQGDADQLQGSLDEATREAGQEVVTTDVRTSELGEHEEITSLQAGFGNRLSVEQSPDATGRRCRIRSRLTPSLPSKAGAMWYSVPVPVTRGFETLFTFQASNRICTEHSDPLFSRRLHSTCSVRGGDGLAFVLHRDPREAEAVGGVGADMGYGGLRDSLAVELDHRYNPGEGSSDLVYDHVGVHSAGRGSNNSALDLAELAPAAVWDLADGQHHLVKVKYFPRVAVEYLAHFAATPKLVPFLKDNGEGRRLGTLVVWLDDGIASDEPLLAVPINLSVLLDLPQDQAYVGFTAGTGRSWAKHDVLAWYWCHNDGGGLQEGGDAEGGRSDDNADVSWKGCGETPSFSAFSYGQSTEYHPESRLTQQAVELRGDGYGGGGATDEATTVVAAPKGHWAAGGGGNHWVGGDREQQVPPATEN
ncbi:unnamed protein product, partial [Pylaiella littoralis]